MIIVAQKVPIINFKFFRKIMPRQESNFNSKYNFDASGLSLTDQFVNKPKRGRAKNVGKFFEIYFIYLNSTYKYH
ncbi:hypothetical protein BpHYR1_052302 [Brachionus plicatilis]|uniref:Uncharacterized protein n=1 Tax=Brachionus plicatilis TaxID=10195 RepID=A0A3M7QUL7_BRAPC|nr:hypothetical protein BpHYR1_052302 [Brachionus plicatilis]